MSNPTHIELAVDGSLATVTISSNTGVNVLSSGTMTQLGEVIDRIANNRDIRFSVIRAEGKVFIAGADIKEMSSLDAPAARNFGQLGTAVFDAIEALPCITVAALTGAALGGGCEIALACDFRIATKNVQIGLPETTLGLIPGWGGIARAAKLLGAPAAKKLIFSGTPISAEEATRINLIDQVVANANEMDLAIQALRESFQKSGPVAISLVKRAMRDGQDLAAFAACFTDSESTEGMTAFLEKRPPTWVEG